MPTELNIECIALVERNRSKEPVIFNTVTDEADAEVEIALIQKAAAPNISTLCVQTQKPDMPERGEKVDGLSLGWM